jgi:benzoyl-CoA reductase/2-hydroxyglutaryl-CoA dehydratase subunit BcrC/BadD/HgdB
MCGSAVSEEALESAWRIYEAYRAAMRDFASAAAHRPDVIGARRRHLLIKAGYFMDKQIYTNAIRQITEGLQRETGEASDAKHGLRAVLTGYIGEPVEILDILDENGISVVADDLAHESRQFRVVGSDAGDALARMADRILSHDGCTFLYDGDKRRGENLVKAVREGRADAVIVFMMKFCDPEEFDYPIYKKELEDAGIPLLYLETEQQMDSFEQVRTRIQSFAEMLI